MTLENIDIPMGTAQEKEEEICLDEEMTMAVSPVCQKDGKQYAFVSFTVQEKHGDDKTAACVQKTAEGRIPECRVLFNKGFSDKEVEQLERYMKRELTRLKKMASSINVLEAFMK